MLPQYWISICIFFFESNYAIFILACQFSFYMFWHLLHFSKIDFLFWTLTFTDSRKSDILNQFQPSVTKLFSILLYFKITLSSSFDILIWQKKEFQNRLVYFESPILQKFFTKRWQQLTFKCYQRFFFYSELPDIIHPDPKISQFIKTFVCSESP